MLTPTFKYAHVSANPHPTVVNNSAAGARLAAISFLGDGEGDATAMPRFRPEVGELAEELLGSLEDVASNS